MAQQPPLFQPPTQPATGFSAPPATVPAPAAATPFQLPGATPAQQRNVQQQIQNPHAGDGFRPSAAAQPASAAPVAPSTPPAIPAAQPQAAPMAPAAPALPGLTLPTAQGAAVPGQQPGLPGQQPMPAMPFEPTSMAMGAVIGVGASTGLNQLFKENRLARVAHGIDQLPGIKQVSQLIEHVNPLKDATSDAARFIGRTASPAEADRFLTQNVIGNLKKRYPGQADVLQRELGHLTRLSDLDDYLGRPEVAARLESAIPKLKQRTIRGLRKTLGAQKNLSHTYDEVSRVITPLRASGTGPVGRAFASGMSHVKRIFGGDTLAEGLGKKGAAAAKSPLGKLFGPVLSGAFIFGAGIGEAKKGDTWQEKLRLFGHNVLGMGLGSFIGWEATRGVARTVIGKLLGGFGAKVLMLGPLALTPAGVVAEVLAMFVLAKPFQKAGEALAHKLFGTPKPENLEHGAKKAEALPGTLQRDGKFNAFNRPANGATPGVPADSPPVSGLTPDDIRQNTVASEQQQLQQGVISMLNKGWKDSDSVFPTDIVNPAKLDGGGGH